MSALASQSGRRALAPPSVSPSSATSARCSATARFTATPTSTSWAASPAIPIRRCSPRMLDLRSGRSAPPSTAPRTAPASPRICAAPSVRRSTASASRRRKASRSASLSIRPELLALLGSTVRTSACWRSCASSLPKYLENPGAVHPTLAGAGPDHECRTRGDEALFEEYKKRFENASIADGPCAIPQRAGPLPRSRAAQESARISRFTGAVRPNEMFVLWGGARHRAGARRTVRLGHGELRRTSRSASRPPSPRTCPSSPPAASPSASPRPRILHRATRSKARSARWRASTEQVNECAALRAREMTAVSAYLGGTP